MSEPSLNPVDSCASCGCTTVVYRYVNLRRGIFGFGRLRGDALCERCMKYIDSIEERCKSKPFCPTCGRDAVNAEKGEA